jgi:hypothetical protein
MKKLRMRIKGLRDELRCLLSPEDTRWYRFGFRRPVDGSTPDLIEALTLRPAGEGTILAEWRAARLADNYRVSWEVTDTDAEPTEVGLVSDPKAILTGLPVGESVTVTVTARNRTGESGPVRATIVLSRQEFAAPAERAAWAVEIGRARPDEPQI